MSTSMSMKKAPNRPIFGRRPICQAGMVRGWHWDSARMVRGWRGDDSGVLLGKAAVPKTALPGWDDAGMARV